MLVSPDTDSGTILAQSGATFRGGVPAHDRSKAALLLANLAEITERSGAGSVVVFKEARLRIRRLPIVIYAR